MNYTVCMIETRLGDERGVKWMNKIEEVFIITLLWALVQLVCSCLSCNLQALLHLIWINLDSIIKKYKERANALVRRPQSAGQKPGWTGCGGGCARNSRGHRCQAQSLPNEAQLGSTKAYQGELQI